MQEILHIPENKYGYTAKNLDKYLAEAMYSKEHLSYLSNIFIGFSFTTVLFLKGYMLYILLSIETVVIIHLFVIERKLNWMRFLVLTVAIGILLTVLVGGVNDGTRDRVLLPIAPFLVFILFDLVDILTLRKAFFKKSQTDLGNNYVAQPINLNSNINFSFWAFERAFCCNLFALEKSKKDFHYNP